MSLKEAIQKYDQRQIFKIIYYKHLWPNRLDLVHLISLTNFQLVTSFFKEMGLHKLKMLIRSRDQVT